MDHAQEKQNNWRGGQIGNRHIGLAMLTKLKDNIEVKNKYVTI